MSARSCFAVAVGLLATGCTLFGASERSSSRHMVSSGESVESADAGALCWDSSNVILCGGSAYKQCAAVPGEGCVRCTCAIGTPSTVPRWGSSSTVWSDRENQNLMGQPRVP